MEQLGAYRVLINGIVQGVGFRPFIYNLAVRNQLGGWVRNTSRGVEVEICGTQENLSRFLDSIEDQAPPLSQIETIQIEAVPPEGQLDFKIQQSKVVEGAFQPISPDISICQDCLDELFTPADFRYRYPFINCTNCGPRFTIIQDIPYDRPKTTMAEFVFCPVCRNEYEDPLDRRFHAQPVACQTCGPQVWLEPSGEKIEQAAVADQAILETQRLLQKGKIIAIKGLGGFHLACDGLDQDAVSRLRERKSRPAKPLAVMMPDIETVRKYCQVSEEEENLLMSPRRPILLLKRRDPSDLPPEIAPGQKKIGVMLPYTPLHYLLFASGDDLPDPPCQVLIMTSANIRGNPILTDNQQVREELGSIADHFLMHDRDIHVQCDDSVFTTVDLVPDQFQRSFPIRRSRGYTPQPLISPLSGGSLLAVGAELKNTFCHIKDRYALISQHLGDLKNYPGLVSFEESISHFETLFRVTPALLVHDSHPDYLSTRYALGRAEQESLPTLSVQHHHAHIASCLADNGDPGTEPVIGLSFDGSGYGDDGSIWGGEVLIADYQGYQRFGHLQCFPLPGGDLAVREPWRTALSLLDRLGMDWAEDLSPVAYAQSSREAFPGVTQLGALRKQLESKTNTPLTSSLGRLFDAVASLLGIRQTISYEGQAAIELEAIADPGETGSYQFEILPDNSFSPAPLIRELLADLRNHTSLAVISARFHNGLAAAVLEISDRAQAAAGLSRVALSGGVWQNITLLKTSYQLLTRAGFEVLLHHNIPPNDGGVSLGQAVIGQNYLLAED